MALNEEGSTFYINRQEQTRKNVIYCLYDPKGENTHYILQGRRQEGGVII